MDFFHTFFFFIEGFPYMSYCVVVRRWTKVNILIRTCHIDLSIVWMNLVSQPLNCQEQPDSYFKKRKRRINQHTYKTFIFSKYQA